MIILHTRHLRRELVDQVLDCGVGGLPIGGRLERGRSYARRGQVVSMTTDKGRVKASVQGSQPRPYQVTIALQTLASDHWDKLKDSETDCSCPDWSNPCKHVTAVYYLLGEEFDRDPFLLFRLRGMSREELLERLHSSTGGLTPGQETSILVAGGRSMLQPPEPLTSDSSRFWGGQTP